MAEEQIVYLSPEEDVTSVRERLGHILSDRIILVVPAQTQLRSHVGWRLLHAHAQKMERELLVVSADHQLRSVISAAGFRVSDSLEFPSKTPLSTRRLNRRDIARKTPTSTYFRARSAREPLDNRKINRSDDLGQHYDFRIAPSSATSQNVSQQEDETDLLLEDIHYAQSIRRAAQQSPEAPIVANHDVSSEIEDLGDEGNFISHSDSDTPRDQEEHPLYRSSFVSRQAEPKPVDLSPVRRNLSTSAPLQVKSNPAPVGYSSRKLLSRSHAQDKSRILVPMVISILILLFMTTFIYLGPSADVTLAVPARHFSMPLQLTATNQSHPDQRQHTIPAEKVFFHSNMQATGQASGSIKIGTIQAYGSVTFTNQGSQAIDIPTGTILTSRDGTSFITTADTLVSPSHSGSNTNPPVPIEAQSPGENGNVSANSITIIPTDSLRKISQFNKNTLINLNVNNISPTNGGGVGNARIVTQDDINTLSKTLDQKLQTQAQNWLKLQLHSGDEQGKPILNESSRMTPSVGSITHDGIFTEVLDLHMSILIVRAKAIQLAAMTHLSEAVHERQKGYVLVSQHPLTLTAMKNIPVTDGSSFTINFTALGQIVPQILLDKVQNMVAGKTLAAVRGTLMTNVGSPGTVKVSTIEVYPGFFPWIPFWPQRVTLHIDPCESCRF